MQLAIGGLRNLSTNFREFANYRYGTRYFGGCPGVGAPSSATATVGTVSAVYVQNNPTIRIKTLNARFMGSFSFAGPLGAETLVCKELYGACQDR